MNKLLFLISLLFILFAPNLHANDSLKKIEIAVGEYKPFVTEFIEGYGQSTELVTAIIERMGYKPTYLFMPWGQAEKKVASSQNNEGPRGTFPYFFSKKRDKFFLFSKIAILESCIKIFYNKNKVTKHHPKSSKSDSITISNIKDLAIYKLGYVHEKSGYEYPEEIAPTLKNHGVYFTSQFEMFSALIDQQSKIEAIPADVEVGQEILFDLFPEDRFRIGIMRKKNSKDGNTCLVKKEAYFIVSKINPDNAEFIKKFDETHRGLSIETIERIKRKARERPSLQKPDVVLNVHNVSIRIIGYDSNGKTYFIPRGTHGKLLKWTQGSDNKLGDSEKNPSRNKQKVEAEVILFTGPYRGKKLILDGKFIELIR